MLVDAVSGTVVKEEVVDGPLYYDYSEQFEREQILEPEANPIPTGFAKSFNTIQEERGSPQQPASPARGGWDSGAMQVSSTAVPDIVELPASPVARRITRNMILEALGPASTIEDVNDIGEAAPTDDSGRRLQHGDMNAGQTSVQTMALTRDAGVNKRFSVLSQADSSVIDSSTLDFAVRCSIPAVTGAQVGSVVPPMPDRDPPLPPDTAPSTEADMSDLLAGYQHTESRQGDDSVSKTEEKKIIVEASKERVVESRSNHAQKSSDPQSFKSATDVLESEHSEDDDAKSYKSFSDAVVEKQPSVKETDAHSFKTAQGTATPGRSVSVPVTKALPIIPAEMPTPRPTSSTPLSTPAPVVLRRPRVPHETTFPLAKLRASSKPSMKQGPASISGSSSTLSGSHQPPLVPTRESSASKEAQRSMGVASWLLLKRCWTKRATKDEDLTKTDNNSRETLRETRPSNGVASSQHSLGDAITTPEKALFKETTLPRTASPRVTIPRKPVPKKERDQPQVHNASAAASLHQSSLSRPEPAIAEPSSVYCSKDSTSVSRVQSSPAGIPKTVDSRRDSKTTTHLAWPGRRSLNLNNPSASNSEPNLPLPSSSDDTTTDLRLSQYRYPGGLHYLPDLKEESHEDSSLNTSASNLKNSNFRYPFGVPGGVRASVDDGALFSRRSSMGSHRKSALGSELSQAHELPSMRFSCIDLYEQVDEVVRLRSSRSLDPMQVEAPESHGDTPPRPVSAGEMREKYRSLCDRLDQFNTLRDIARADMTNPMFMQRMAEIEQVTVPSVNGLTERLSEMLPALKEAPKIEDQGMSTVKEMLSLDHNLAPALENIHEVGGPAQKRSSARLRPMPGCSTMVVVDDALYEDITYKEKEDNVAIAQGDEGVGRAQGESHASEMTKANSSTRPKTPLAELPTLSPPLLRPRAVTVGNRNIRASVESGLTTRSLRSFTPSPTKTDTRPWNSDKNYPWATPSVDISLPPPTSIRTSPHHGPSHLRSTLSTSSTASTFTTPVRSPFGIDSDLSAHARQLHRFSQFGRSNDQPHEAGERYPTAAPTPPTAILRDDFSTSDTSDDDTELRATRKGRFNLKSRFSSTRNPTLEHSTRATVRSLKTSVNPLELASPGSAHRSATPTLQDSTGEARVFNSNRHTFRDAQGMPSAVYHRHRLIDHLKRWWQKGGDLIRSLSRKPSTNTSE